MLVSRQFRASPGWAAGGQGFAETVETMLDAATSGVKMLSEDEWLELIEG